MHTMNRSAEPIVQCYSYRYKNPTLRHPTRVEFFPAGIHKRRQDSTACRQQQKAASQTQPYEQTHLVILAVDQVGKARHTAERDQSNTLKLHTATTCQTLIHRPATLQNQLQKPRSTEAFQES